MLAYDAVGLAEGAVFALLAAFFGLGLCGLGWRWAGWFYGLAPAEPTPFTAWTRTWGCLPWGLVSLGSTGLSALLWLAFLHGQRAQDVASGVTDILLAALLLLAYRRFPPGKQALRADRVPPPQERHPDD